ncbi:unnamed protein product [Oppiella nova]|uniref:Phorbol-ester/DAG-type domain-containing protein n=1 Tax=Oppiella nova TaxID=334625 RepID=A0A7R9L961_9ACAR|nr:unnamed protein product [Oppiella nova]CAG2160346.1 unnamed protein product [Oppiella nova]
MSANKRGKQSDKRVVKEAAVGGDATDASEVTELRRRLDEFEDRHDQIKEEFHSLKTLNDDMTQRHESELKALKGELRYASKEVEKYRDINKYLREEKRELKDQMNKMNASIDELKRLLEDKDIQLNETIRNQDKSVRQLTDELRALHDQNDAKQLHQQVCHHRCLSSPVSVITGVCDHRCLSSPVSVIAGVCHRRCLSSPEMRDNYEKRVRELSDETKTLRDQLNKELNWKRKYEDSVKKGEQNSNRLQDLYDKIHNLESELTAKANQIDTKDRENRKLKNTNKILQDQCKEMDKQAEQFKTKYVGIGAQREKLKADKDSTLSEVQKLSKDLQFVRNKLDATLKERDDIFARLEAQRIEYEALIDTERQKLAAIQKELHNECQKSRELEERFSVQEQNMYSNDEVIISLDAKISILEEQLIAIKEEAAKHITTIGTLKMKNAELSVAYKDRHEKVEELEDRIESLHHQMDVKEDEMNRERDVYNQQLIQQKKAIDHLQDKNDSLLKQKKPLFSITPTKMFVSNSPRPPPNCPLDSKDIYKALAEEKSNNRRLVDEIAKLKGDANFFKNEVFQLKNSIKTDDSSLNSQSNDVFRKPLFTDNRNRVPQRVENRVHNTADTWSLGSQRMHHNIPHRFVEITTKIPNTKCVSCADNIHFGRKAVRCSECSATTHTKCSHKMPNNCGLPVQMMQQLFHSSYDVDNQLDDDYYQSQRVDDVIRVEPLEPSAPEETFVKYEDHSDSSGTTDNNEPDSGAAMSDAILESEFREIVDICDNKENDGFSFTDSMIEVLDRHYK